MAPTAAAPERSHAGPSTRAHLESHADADTAAPCELSPHPGQVRSATGSVGRLGTGERSVRIGDEPVPLPKVRVPDLDLAKLLAGDWLGALRVAVPAWATAVGLSVILMVVVHPNGASIKEFLVAVAAIVSSAFGGDVIVSSASADTDFLLTVSFGAYPLTVTLTALAVGGWLFGRQIREHSSWVPVLFDALRSSVVFAFLVGLVVISLRGNIRAPGQALAEQIFGEVSGDAGGRVVSAVLISFGLFFLTTAASLLRRRIAVPTVAGHVRDTVGPPLSGLLAMVAASWFVGVFVAIGIFIAEKESHNSTAIATLIAVLPNLGLGGALAGGGAGLRYDVDTSTKGASSDQTVHLTYLADHVTSWVWLLPLALLLVFAAGAVGTVVRSASKKAAAQNLVIWIVACALLVPLLGHFVGARLHYRESGASQRSADAFLGLSTGSVFLVALLASFVLALVGSALLRGRQADTPQQRPGHGGAAAYSDQPVAYEASADHSEQAYARQQPHGTGRLTQTNDPGTPAP